jgi:c-di-GMP-binding flagellar brake protein YcgR
VKSKDFKIRERLECLVQQNGREVHFLVRIQDIESGRLRVDQPIVDQMILQLEVGTRLKVHFHRVDGSYEFDTYIIGKDQINMPCLILAEPQDVVRIQRREYFRVDASIEITLVPHESSSFAGSDPIIGEVVNISAGGAKIKVKPEDFHKYGRKGEHFLLSFDLPTRVSLKDIHSEIVNLQRFPDELCYFHLCFIKIEDALRREIVVYNFHRQRNQLKRWTDPQYLRP